MGSAFSAYQRGMAAARRRQAQQQQQGVTPLGPPRPPDLPSQPTQPSGSAPNTPPQPPPYTGPATDQEGGVHVRALANLMSMYSQNGVYTAAQLRQAAIANDSNPALRTMLMRLADLSDLWGGPIRQEELVRLASADEFFSPRDLFNLPHVAGWGHTPPAPPAGQSGFDYMRIIFALRQHDNGDGVYTPEELRVAARNSGGDEKFLFELMADISDSYRLPDGNPLYFTNDSLQILANRNGNDRFFSLNEVADFPRQAGAQLIVQENHGSYADFIVLLGLFARFDRDGDGRFSKNEMRNARKALEKGEITLPQGVNKDDYIDTIHQLEDIAQSRNTSIEPWRLRRLAYADGGGGRWIDNGDRGFLWGAFNGSEINASNLGY